MLDEVIVWLCQIVMQIWQCYFDDSLGLVDEESWWFVVVCGGQMQQELFCIEILLVDKLEYKVVWEDGYWLLVECGDLCNVLGFDMQLLQVWQNMGELYNLIVWCGMLIEEDCFVINNYIVQMLVMLKSLLWLDLFKSVFDIVVNYYEKMDGIGYLCCLCVFGLFLQDRVMVLVDVFEVFMVVDCLYKLVKILLELLCIMVRMCWEQYLDMELFCYFLYSGLWWIYVDELLWLGQCDVVDIVVIEVLLEDRLQIV